MNSRGSIHVESPAQDLAIASSSKLLVPRFLRAASWGRLSGKHEANVRGASSSHLPLTGTRIAGRMGTNCCYCSGSFTMAQPSSGIAKGRKYSPSIWKSGCSIHDCSEVSGHSAKLVFARPRQPSVSWAGRSSDSALMVRSNPPLYPKGSDYARIAVTIGAGLRVPAHCLAPAAMAC